MLAKILSHWSQLTLSSLCSCFTVTCSLPNVLSCSFTVKHSNGFFSGFFKAQSIIGCINISISVFTKTVSCPEDLEIRIEHFFPPDLFGLYIWSCRAVALTSLCLQLQLVSNNPFKHLAFSRDLNWLWLWGTFATRKPINLQHYTAHSCSSLHCTALRYSNQQGNFFRVPF